MLIVIETHPIQYHAPVWRAVQQEQGIPVTAIYGSDFSIAGYQDQEFGATFRWDTDLLSGYTPRFLSRMAEAGAKNADEVNTRGLADALRHNDCRAVLSVGYSPRFHRDAFRCARRTGLPILFRGETTDHARRRGLLKRIVRDTALRWHYARCAILLHVGRRSREHFARLGFGARAGFFSPYCVEVGPFRVNEAARAELREPARAALGVRPEQRVVMFCGKLSPRKGPDVLLAALAALPMAMRDQVFLLLVGDGELRKELLARAAATNLPAKCVGFQPQLALSGHYHAADVLVLPSRSGETWGLVVNEALHHGVPAVVTDAVGCAPDLVVPGETGEICAADSIPSLADALRRFWERLTDPLLRGRCRAQMEAYTVSHAAAGIAAAYRQVVEAGVSADSGLTP